MELLPPGAEVLEVGSGPGLHARHLEERGLRVRRTDGARAFVERLRAQGHTADLLDVRTDALPGPLDAVLASAVLLHLTRAEMADFLRRAAVAVRAGGVLAFSVKVGDGEAWSTAKLGLPRFFVYWREPALREVLREAGWTVLDVEHVAARENWLMVTARPA